MKSILLPIHPEYIEMILSGTKRYEYRTKIPKEDIDRIVMYATSPIQQVIGEAKVIEIIALPPASLWAITKDYAGIDKEAFDDYFKGRDIAYAYQLGDAKRYEEPRSLNAYGLKAAPQSFKYL